MMTLLYASTSNATILKRNWLFLALIPLCFLLLLGCKANHLSISFWGLQLNEFYKPEGATVILQRNTGLPFYYEEENDRIVGNNIIFAGFNWDIAYIYLNENGCFTHVVLIMHINDIENNLYNDLYSQAEAIEHIISKGLTLKYGKPFVSYDNGDAWYRKGNYNISLFSHSQINSWAPEIELHYSVIDERDPEEML